MVFLFASGLSVSGIGRHNEYIVSQPSGGLCRVPFTGVCVCGKSTVLNIPCVSLPVRADGAGGEGGSFKPKKRYSEVWSSNSLTGGKARDQIAAEFSVRQTQWGVGMGVGVGVAEREAHNKEEREIEQRPRVVNCVLCFSLSSLLPIDAHVCR